jgi:hypothetical protein
MKVWVLLETDVFMDEKMLPVITVYNKKPRRKTGWIPKTCRCCGIIVRLEEKEVIE